jgi:large subunit ribosomal protein L30
MAGIRVRLIRSRAARSRDQLATLTGLGLYKLGQERVLPDNPSTLGACEKLRHMVAWERVEASPVKRPRRSHKKPAAQQA